MKTLENKSENWQGWNEFLGILKENDIHNYLVNLIGDIKDDYRKLERIMELMEILVSETSDTYKIHSVDLNINVCQHDNSTYQYLIYYIDTYFVMVSAENGIAVNCRYIGESISDAAKRLVNELMRNNEMAMIEIYSEYLSTLILKGKSISNIDSDNSEIASYKITAFSNTEYLNMINEFSEFKQEGSYCFYLSKYSTINYIHMSKYQSK